MEFSSTQIILTIKFWCADRISLIVERLETIVFDHLSDLTDFWFLMKWKTESIKERKVNSLKFSLKAKID